MTQENKPTYEELEKELNQLKADTERQTKYLGLNMMVVVAKLSEICIDNNLPFRFNIEDYTTN